MLVLNNIAVHIIDVDTDLTDDAINIETSILNLLNDKYKHLKNDRLQYGIINKTIEIEYLKSGYIRITKSILFETKKPDTIYIDVSNPEFFDILYKEIEQHIPEFVNDRDK